MASEGPGDTSEASSAPSKVTKPKRRRIKREGKPGFQFVVATSDLSQFQDEESKRNIRSQAMISWRHADKEKKTKHGQASTDKGKRRQSQDASAFDPSFNADDIKPSIEDLLRQTPEDPSSFPTLGLGQQGQHRAHSPTYLAWWGSVPFPDFEQYSDPVPPSQESPSIGPSSSTASTPYASSSSQALVSHGHESSSRSPSYGTPYFQALTLRSRRIVDYEDSNDHERITYLTLMRQVTRFYGIGNGADPFHAIPRFKNPELDSVILTRNSVRSFTSEETMKKWFPAIVSNPHMILSSTCLVSTWLDMKEGISGDSKRTAMVKEETFAMIKARLADPKLQSDNTTLMAILHVLAGEMWSCSAATLRVHLSGVTQFVHQRGGMEALGGRGGGLADVTVSCCLSCNILHETEPNPLFFSWKPDPADLTSALPESPVFCPRPEYNTIRESSRCSSVTYGLLCDMRNLTELFLEEQNTVDLDDSQYFSRGDGRSAPLNYDAMASRIQNRLFHLPSAHTPGLPISNDWVYESCRIAALIYSAALIWRVPFSATGASAPNSRTYDPVQATPQPALADILFETLQRADTYDLWDDMAGVLYWISTVGAAAARVPETLISSDTKSQSQAEKRMIWVQRCLTMYSNRTMIVLIFQQPTAIITSQKTLLRVQQRLGSQGPMM